MASSKKLLVKALLRSAEVQVALKSALSGVDSIALEIVEGTLLSHADKLSLPVPPDVLVVDVDLDDAEQLARLQEVVRNGAGHLPVIATSATASVNGVRSLMRFQIADYLPQPLVPKVGERVEGWAIGDHAVPRRGRGGGGGGARRAWADLAGVFVHQGCRWRGLDDLGHTNGVRTGETGQGAEQEARLSGGSGYAVRHGGDLPGP